MKCPKEKLALFLILGGLIMFVQPTRVTASDNLLVNADFEDWNNPTSLNDWSWDNISNNTYVQETTNVVSGSSSLKLIKDNDTEDAGFTQDVTDIDRFTYYTFSVWVYDNNPNASIYIHLYINGPWGYAISSDNPEWQLLSVTVQSDIQIYSTWVNIKIQDQGTTPGGYCYVDAAGFVEGTSPLDTKPPEITITNPGNQTYPSSPLWLNFTLNEPTSWIGYSMDGADNVTISNNTLLSYLLEGPHNITLFANDSEGNMVLSTQWFTIDPFPPDIVILYPMNTTYSTDSIWLSVDLKEPCSWIGYSLDGEENVTTTGLILLEDLSVGTHFLFVYANDSVNNMGISVVRFTIEEVPLTTWITYTTIIPVTTWISQTKNTADFAAIAVFAGFVSILILNRKKKE